MVDCAQRLKKTIQLCSGGSAGTIPFERAVISDLWSRVCLLCVLIVWFWRVPGCMLRVNYVCVLGLLVPRVLVELKQYMYAAGGLSSEGLFRLVRCVFLCCVMHNVL